MSLVIAGSLAPFAAREAWLDGIEAPAREAALAELVGEGTVEAVDGEVEAAIAAAALPLPVLVDRYALDAGKARAIAFGAARAIRHGQATAAVLGALPESLLHEEVLHLAALLRIESIAEAGARAGDDAMAHAVDQASALLDGDAADQVVERACDVLAAIARASRPLRVRVFSEAVARMLQAADRARRAASARTSLDGVIGSILAGGAPAELAAARARPFADRAARSAFLVGRVVAHEPSWWPELESALFADHGGWDFPAMPLLLLGLGDTRAVAGDGPLRGVLVRAARAPRDTVRQCALRALAARRDESDEALAALRSAARDPEPAIRVELAAALARAGAATSGVLWRLVEDPFPAVRAAAAWSALARGEATAELSAILDEDLRAGGPGAALGAAAAAACVGVFSTEIGERLLVAGTAEALSGPEWEGLARWTSPAFPLALFASTPAGADWLYERAASDDTALLALGAALGSGWAGLGPAPSVWREDIRLRALRLLPSDDEDVRVRAATALARHAEGDRRLLEALVVEGRPPAELLQVLAVLAPRVGLAAPELVPGLVAVLDDEEAEDEERSLALACLGEVAPPDDDRVARLLVAQCDGPQASAAYGSLARLVARRR